MYYMRDEKAKYYDCDHRNLLKVSAAMKYMQQTSSEHLASLGYSVEKLYGENMVFLLSKINIKIHRMPMCSEELRVGTAVTQPKGPRFFREFIIDSATGERLISGLSLWILVDPASRRIYRPASFPYPFHFEEAQLTGIVEDVRFPKAQGSATLHSEIPVQYSHIDVNRHVNNTIYADFVCDILPYELLEQKDIGEISIAFQNEARHGDLIQLNACDCGEDAWHIAGLHGGSACFEAFVKLNSTE